MNTDPNQLLENWEKDLRKDFSQAWNSDEKRHDIENGLVYIVRNLLALQEAKTREECAKLVIEEHVCQGKLCVGCDIASSILSYNKNKNE